MGLIKSSSRRALLLLQISSCLIFVSAALCLAADEGVRVPRDERRSIVKTEYGEITAADTSDGLGNYHLQFFTLQPNALFLPAILHGEMVLYCHSGSGNLLWAYHNKRQVNVSLVRGDVYRVRPGSAFYMESNVDEGLGISAIFAASEDDLHAPSIGAYSSISDMVRGFDSSVLRSAFKVPDEVIETIKNATRQPPIIQNVAREESSRPFRDWETRFMETMIGINRYNMASMENKKEKEGRTFNVFREDRDVENCNGWSLTVTKKELHAFDDSRFGVFYVNLSTGAMMGPHWNPLATEIAMVVAGQGMVRSICPSTGNVIECENTRFRVEEGDVFVVPRYRPMAQMSFNNESFVFVGFSTARKKNYPQYLAGKASVLQVIDKKVLSAAFNVDNATIEQLLAPQKDAIILECTSCAEEEYGELEEEARERAEEEEAKKREEEERKRREEKEEARRREEEKRRQEEEEEARRREEEEEARRREEEKRRQKEEEEARKREEEERRKKEEEEEEEEEEERREREEEAERREQEEERERQEEEEEARRQEQERQQREEAARREQEEEQRRQQEEQARREQEREEQERQQREEAAREQEERQRRQEEEEEEEEERQRREQGEEERGPGGGESEEEIARRQEEERERREREQGGGGGGEPVRLLKKIWKI